MTFVKQMDPGYQCFRYYTITDNTSAAIAQVLVPKENVTLEGVTYYVGTEYWFDVVTSLPSTTRQLNVGWDDYPCDKSGIVPGTLSFRMEQNVEWDRANPPSSGSTVFVDNTAEIIICWNLTYSSGTWGGNLTWYNTNGESNVFSGSAPGSAILTASTAPVSGSWYTAEVPPV